KRNSWGRRRHRPSDRAVQRHREGTVLGLELSEKKIQGGDRFFLAVAFGEAESRLEVQVRIVDPAIQSDVAREAAEKVVRASLLAETHRRDGGLSAFEGHVHDSVGDRSAWDVESRDFLSVD